VSETNSAVAGGVGTAQVGALVNTSPAGIDTGMPPKDRWHREVIAYRELFRALDEVSAPGPERFSAAFWGAMVDRIFVGLGRGPREEDEAVWPGYARQLLPLSRPTGDADFVYRMANTRSVIFPPFIRNESAITHLLIFERYGEGYGESVDRFLGATAFLRVRDDVRAGDSSMIPPGSQTFEVRVLEAGVQSLPKDWNHHPRALKLRGEEGSSQEETK
jgi:hypothetical protein